VSDALSSEAARTEGQVKRKPDKEDADETMVRIFLRVMERVRLAEIGRDKKAILHHFINCKTCQECFKRAA